MKELFFFDETFYWGRSGTSLFGLRPKNGFGSE